MIVVDENIYSRAIMASIAGWYRGQVISVTQLRPHSVIRDDAIPTLPLQFSQPTFVTTNVDDFWQVVQPHPAYCVVCLSILKDRNSEAPDLPAFGRDEGIRRVVAYMLPEHRGMIEISEKLGFNMEREEDMVKALRSCN